MKNKTKHLTKIRRNYRIDPAPELLKFWETIEKEQLQNDWIPFRYFKIKLMTIQQIAEFDFKKIRFWFKNRAKVHLVHYYIPLAYDYTVGRFCIIAAYDRAKNFIGVFHCNLTTDPIFLTADLFSLLENKTPTMTKKEFLYKHVSNALIKEINFDTCYFEEDIESKEFLQHKKAILDFLEYVKLISDVISYEEKMTIKPLKKAIKLSFQHYNKDYKFVQLILDVPLLTNESYSETILPILNWMNYRWWNWDSTIIPEYGFFRFEEGVVMLHLEQLCEFVRQGVIPNFANVNFPSIVFSTHPSGYKNILEYEVGFFETQEEYDQYYKEFMESKEKPFVRRLEEKDIPKILDYFFDKPPLTLNTDGIDINKIQNEEQFTIPIELSLKTEDAQKKDFFIIFMIDHKSYGHCHIERITKKDAYFYFYYWDNIYNKPPIVDQLIKQSILLIQETFSIKTLYAEPTPNDEYRNDVFQRGGFELVKQHEIERDDISVKQIYNLWKLDL